MKKMYCAVLGLALTLSTFLVSCEQEKNGLEPATSNEVIDIEKVRIEFSKALAQALKEKEVRQFLKNEALQKYDGDYDVLYAFVKDKKLTNGKTLEETLAKYANGADVKNWSAQVPLMTVFIPNLAGFNPETWNVDSQTPDVVLDNSHLKEKTDKLVAFTSDLKEYDVDTKKAPSFPVVVVKENERIIAKSKLDGNARKDVTLFEKSATKIIKEDNSSAFYFIGDVDPKVADKSNAKTGVWYDELGAPKLSFDTPLLENQRDWVYYHINPVFNTYANEHIPYTDFTKGTFGDYTEKLTGFQLNSPLAIAAITDDWTEGALEFHVLLSFIYRDGSIQTDLKVFYCTPGQLVNNGTIIDYNPNLELMPWDIYRYGDEWKLSILEHDAGGSITKTVSAKSTFGYNFEGSFKIFKIGVKFGTTGSFEKSSSQTVTISSESDQLGDVRFLYENPVVERSPTLGGKYNVLTVSSGAVNIGIEPTMRSVDNRPRPSND